MIRSGAYLTVGWFLGVALLVTSCGPPQPPSVVPPDRLQEFELRLGEQPATVTEMVRVSILDWQQWRGQGVSDSVKKFVVEEYVTSSQRCQTDTSTLQEDIRFFVFQYLNIASEEGIVYSPEIICDPLVQTLRRKRNQYGILKVMSPISVTVSIDNVLFDSQFTSFLLTSESHKITIILENQVVCQENVVIETGKALLFDCDNLSS